MQWNQTVQCLKHEAKAFVLIRVKHVDVTSSGSTDQSCIWDSALSDPGLSEARVWKDMLEVGEILGECSI